MSVAEAALDGPKIPARRLTLPSWFGAAATSVIYVIGVVLRWFYTTAWHDPNKYVYSDMAMYVSLARRLSQHNYVLGIGDVTHPPGNTWILMYFMAHFPTLPGEQLPHALVLFLFVISALVPLSIGLLGWVTFGKRAAYGSICLASAYFAFIDFGGYFLAEIHLTFLGPLIIAAYIGAMKLVASDPSPKRTAGVVGLAVTGGILFSLAMALKMVTMPAVLGFCGIHFLFSRRPKVLQKIVVLAIFLLASAPLTGKIVVRCTEANDHHFCSGSNKSAADFLMGHYGRIQAIEWRDPKFHGYVGFGNPAAYQHGYRETRVVPFLITNQEMNNKYAWNWVRGNPGQALVLGVEHIWDSFGGSYAWPPAATAVWAWSYAFHFLFLGFVLFPALVLLTDVLRKRGVMGLMRSDEMLVVSPIIGVCVAVFAATGEVRYRVPWDGLFMILAVEFYGRMKLRFWEPKQEAAGEAPANADGEAPPARTKDEDAAGGDDHEKAPHAEDATPEGTRDAGASEGADDPEGAPA